MRSIPRIANPGSYRARIRGWSLGSSGQGIPTAGGGGNKAFPGSGGVLYRKDSAGIFPEFFSGDFEKFFGFFTTSFRNFFVGIFSFAGKFFKIFSEFFCKRFQEMFIQHYSWNDAMPYAQNASSGFALRTYLSERCWDHGCCPARPRRGGRATPCKVGRGRNRNYYFWWHYNVKRWDKKMLRHAIFLRYSFY